MSLLITLTKKIAKVLAYLLCILIVMIVLPPIVMLILGYKVNVHSDELARKLVDSKKGPQACMKIVNYGILGPSSGESQAHCVKRYAEYAKDPSACELLMPSSYGWSCLGAAMDHRLCIIGEGPENTVRGQGRITTYDACVSGDTETKEYACCVMARILQEKDEPRDCASLKTAELQDECHYFLAQKTVEGEACGSIVNERTRVGCEVAVRALQKK